METSKNVTADAVFKDLNKLKNSQKAKLLGKYFKTGEGEYGAGDIFIGITVPVQRAVAKKYIGLSLVEIKRLLEGKIHEYRFTALEILVFKFAAATSETEKKKIADFYLKNRKYINNWDLVDTSCRDILGAYLYDKDRGVLYTLAASKNIWDRRIAVISTYYFIIKKDYKDIYALAVLLMEDTHDLMHKAVGWMLREVGKRDRQTLVVFLHKYYKKMPRTMLRYAIEHFDDGERHMYLKGKI